MSIEEVEINESELKKSTSLVNRIKIGTGPGGCEIYRAREWPKTPKGELRRPKDCFVAVKSEIEGRGETWEDAVENLNDLLSKVQE